MLGESELAVKDKICWWFLSYFFQNYLDECYWEGYSQGGFENWCQGRKELMKELFPPPPPKRRSSSVLYKK